MMRCRRSGASPAKIESKVAVQLRSSADCGSRIIKLKTFLTRLSPTAGRL